MIKKKVSISNHEIVEQLKQERRERRIIKPGKWSDVDPRFSVRVKLKKNISISPSLPYFLGKYITHDDGYKGDGHLALVNLVLDNLTQLIDKHGIDNVLAACEKSLNSYKTKEGKKILGDVVIVELLDDRKDKPEKYLSCKIKTNKKHISKFMGMKVPEEGGKGVLQVFE